MPRHRLNNTFAALAAAVLLGACARGDAAEQPLADDLQRDLDMARGTAVELAPKAGGQQVVSDIEAVPPAPRPRPIARAPQKPPTPPKPEPAATPVVAEAEPEPDVSAPAPQPARTTEAPVGAGRPTPTPTQRKAPPGGWKSPSEVIRNAPFPINP